MTLRRAIAAVGLTAGFTAWLAPPVAAEPTPTPAAAVAMDEQDCSETNVSRAVLTTGLDPLVPDRYTLARITPTASSLVVTTYTCNQVSVDGQPVVGQDKTTTVTIGSATVTHRDGQPLPSTDQQYVLWYGTDNPVQFAKLQQTGLPVYFLPKSSVDTGTVGSNITIDWAIRGAGLDYDMLVTATQPVAAPVNRTTVWWYDGPQGDLQMTYDNVRTTSTAKIVADFTANDVLSDIIVLPRLLILDNPTVTFTFIRGSWTSQVVFVE